MLQFCSPTSQTMPICIHEPPGLVDKASDDLCWACIESFNCTFLCICKLSFVNFPVLSLAPPLILCDCKLREAAHKKRKLTISIGLSSQWNFGRNMHRCPWSAMVCSRRDVWSQKSSCLLSRWAMQQWSFLIGQMREHFALIPAMLKPCSLSICCSPLGSVFLRVNFWESPWYCGSGLFIGISVSFCFLCYPLLDLFMSKAHNASGSSEVCADDWSKINNAQHSGCAPSKIKSTFMICLSNWTRSHHASPPALGSVATACGASWSRLEPRRIAKDWLIGVPWKFRGELRIRWATSPNIFILLAILLQARLKSAPQAVATLALE